MDAQFLASLDALDESARERLARLLSEAEERLLDMDLSKLPRSEDHIGVPPPRGLLGGEVNSPTDVTSAIERTELRWRLDVILALQDYLD